MPARAIGARIGLASAAANPLSLVKTQRPLLTAEWRYLAMLNFAADPALLAAYVPEGTQLDSWRGRTYLSVVGFLFLQTRVLGVPVPLHRTFERVSLRFYVRRRVGERWRRGVVYIDEIVPRSAVALVARALYNRPSRTLPMRHHIEVGCDMLREGGKVEYGWQHRDHWSSLRAEPVGAPQPLTPGSEAEFIAEHYWGYTRQRDGGTFEYAVEHPPWRVWPVRAASLDADVRSLFGAAFVEALDAAPCSAFVADGSPIRVRAGARL
ncbi:DUF2071 domain-containing protein [soil metagenome]